jgi:phosphohistidine swiveling domain-containing protein
MGNDLKSQIKKVDWEFFIRRINAIFYVCIFDKVSYFFNQREFGVSLSKSIYLHKNELVLTYHSKSEMEILRKTCLKLAKSNDPILKKWRDLGLKWLKRKKELFDLTDKIKDMKQIDYDRYMDDCDNICFYGTVIPHQMLDSINHAIENGEPKEDYKDIIEMFNPFRKESFNILHHSFLKELWIYAGKKIRIPNPEDVSYLTPEEVRKIFNEEDYPFQEEINKRKKGCIFYLYKYNIKFYYDASLSEFGIDSNFVKDSEVSGRTTFKGKVKGIVRIVNTPDDIKKLKKDDVLVSINFTPSLSSCIKKVAAVVTDEGGFGSHAAIVSREFKIPCVIGTKIATQVFKDGDLVEVDADKGVVRKIE